MAVQTYTTKDGDVLDDIVQKFYNASGVQLMQQVMLANPGLAALGGVYRAGVIITMPTVNKAVIVPMVRPWGKVGVISDRA